MIACTRRYMTTTATLYWSPSTSSNTEMTSTEWEYIGDVEWIEVHGEPANPSEESGAADESAIVERPIPYGRARNQEVSSARCAAKTGGAQDPIARCGENFPLPRSTVRGRPGIPARSVRRRTCRRPWPVSRTRPPR